MYYLIVLRSLNWRTRRVDCSRIYGKEWQRRVTMQRTSNYMNVAVWIFRNDGQFYTKAQTQTSQTNRFLLGFSFYSWPLLPLRGSLGGGFIVMLAVNKQCILHIFQLQTPKRVPLSCGRSRRSCLRLWGQWRNETHWCLYWRSRDWRRGPRTGTWKASCSPRAMNSTGRRRTMGNTRRNKLTEQVCLSVFQKNLGDFIHNSFYADYSLCPERVTWMNWSLRNAFTHREGGAKSSSCLLWAGTLISRE